MKYILFLLLVISGCFSPALAAEKKDLRDVDITKLILETQVSEVQMSERQNEVHLFWWIPPEYWRTALSGQGMNQMQVEQAMKSLKSYSILGIVQGEVLPSGVFQFNDQDTIASSLAINYSSLEKSTVLEPLETDEIPADLASFFADLKPMLTAALGDMGQNFHFFFVEDNEINRLISPYKQGELKIELASSKNKIIPLVINTPLDSLHVPRVCPNGKEAHISWQYCPWDGSRLEQ